MLKNVMKVFLYYAQYAKLRNITNLRQNKRKKAFYWIILLARDMTNMNSFLSLGN